MFSRKPLQVLALKTQNVRQLSQNQQFKKDAVMKMCRFYELFTGSMTDRIRNVATTAYLKLTLDPVRVC